MIHTIEEPAVVPAVFTHQWVPMQLHGFRELVRCWWLLRHRRSVSPTFYWRGPCGICLVFPTMFKEGGNHAT